MKHFFGRSIFPMLASQFDSAAECIMERVERRRYTGCIKVAGYIVGPSGVGKHWGVGDPLHQFGGVKIAVTGDYCRSKHATCAGTGRLVSNSRIQRYIRREAFRCRRGAFLVDCPRSVKQVEETNAFFRSIGVSQIIVLHIHADWQVCENRIKHRAEIVGRPDDADPEVINRRLSVYFDRVRGLKQTLIPYLADCSDTTVIPIDANTELEIVRRHVQDEVVPIFRDILDASVALS